MTAIIMRNKAREMKNLVEDGLHIFGKVMNMCSQMCEEDEMGERGGYYGNRDMDYPYGDRMGMREPMMPEPWYGDRRGVRGTGRYSMYR